MDSSQIDPTDAEVKLNIATWNQYLEHIDIEMQELSLDNYNINLNQWINLCGMVN